MRRLETTNKQMARGMDTQAMLPVLAAIFEMVSMLFLKWFSVPVMKYSGALSRASIFELSEMESGIARLYDIPPAAEEIALTNASYIRIGAIIGIILLAVFIILAYLIRKKAALIGRIAFAWNSIIFVLAFLWVFDTNRAINLVQGEENTFLSLTINSFMQLTAVAYAQLLIGVIMLFAIGRLLDTKQEWEAEMYISRSVREDKHISKRTILGFVLIFTAIPAVIAFGIFLLNDRSMYFISLCIIFLSMLPFFLVFENRRPQAREIVVIAVMAAMGAVGRAAFFWLPHFNPMAAIVIVSGVALGAEAGFLTGAMAALVSNFLFGQGPWTPWMMFSYGIIGFLAGLAFRRAREEGRKFIWPLCIFGAFCVMCIYGPIMDTNAVTMSINGINGKVFLAYYLSGIPVNIVHASSTFIFLRILGKPLLKKLTRIRTKYGIIEP